MPRPPVERLPCPVCRTCHQGRCTPSERRSVPMCLTVPRNVHTALCEAVPWGERSGWVTRLIARELVGDKEVDPVPQPGIPTVDLVAPETRGWWGR